MQEVYLRKVEDYIIRRCRLEDLPSVRWINQVSLPENYSNFFFEEIYREFPEGFIVAEKDNRVVGYIMSRIEYGFSNIKKFSLARKGHIVSIAVLEAHRGKGLGKALLEEALVSMKKRDCSEVYLEVRASNFQAINLYKKYEFKIVSRIESYYRDGEDAFLMSKAL
ncbi:MAG: ribosomal protein S18-alanine N-acetyltransferase [Nitrososphaerales archaeon]